MSRNDKKCKAILSRGLTEKGGRIIVPREFGSSREHKRAEEKVARRVKHNPSIQPLTTTSKQRNGGEEVTGADRVLVLTHLSGLGRIISPPLANPSDYSNSRS